VPVSGILSRTDDVHFQSVLEQLPVVVYVDRLDDVSSALYVSPQIEALTGYSPEAFARDPELYVRLVHPDDRDLAREGAIRHQLYASRKRSPLPRPLSRARGRGRGRGLDQR
jgi:PAS domain-containing protein